MDSVYSIGNQRRIMRRLLGRPPVDSSHESTGVTSSPLSSQYRQSASQNAVFPAGAPIACLDRSPNGHSAVLGGRHILKTVNFDGLVIREGLDLRVLLANNPDQLSIRDVKWGTGHSSSTIFTACAGGKIFQYDLSRVGPNATAGRGIDFIQTREDSRQVNTLDINPHRGTYMVSGSQDGIVRCFDIRTPIQTRTGPSFRAVQAFKCNADGVRHVQWSPKDAFTFACGTEQGVVLKWDIRKNTAPVLRINAHDKTCSSIAWHHDGDHLASAGWDSKCHIWSMSKTADKRQKPKLTISTPAPVATLAWRPGQWSATAQGKRSSQIAVSYDENSQKKYGINAVHIWDLARPTMPYRELHRFDISPSAMLWHDQYLLWTAGQDGLFNQCDVAFAPKVIDRQTVSTMDFSSRGEVLMFLDERAPPERPRPASHILHPEGAHMLRPENPHTLHPGGTPLTSYSSSPATPRFSVSRSDSEDDAIGSFLGPRRRSSRRRRPGARSGTNLSTTPPDPSVDDILSLEQTIKVTGIYKPRQTMAIGRLPFSVNVDVYQYLTVNYLETLHQLLPSSPGGKPLPERITAILEHYAIAAENVRQFRLAQTWRILAWSMDLVLRTRSQYHFETRMENLRTPFSRKKSDNRAKIAAQSLEMSLELPTDGDITPRKVVSTGSLDTKASHSMSLLARELESTSNVPTPLARPIPDNVEDQSHDTGRGKVLTPIIEPESFTLPPAIHSRSTEQRRRLDSEPLSIVSHDSETTQASTEGYDFYDTETIANAIDVPLGKSAAPPGLDHRPKGSPSRIRRPVLRHDSDESFSQVFSISDGSRRATGLTSSSDGSVPARGAIKAAIMDGVQNGALVEENDFGSRIRGRHLEESPSMQGDLPVRRMLERTDTNFSVFTDEHHMITQTTTDSFESPYRSQTDTEFPLGSPPRNALSVDGYELEDDYRSPYIIERDYLYWVGDPPYPHPVQSFVGPPRRAPPPLQPYSLVSRALAYEAKSSALNASAMVLLLKPLVPDDVIDPFHAAAILRQQHTRLMSMKLFVEAALLRKLCMRGWPGGVLSSWGEDYPAIYNQAHRDVEVGFLCPTCRKPREISRSPNSTDSIWRCERCKARMAPCAVCGHREAPPDVPVPPTMPGLRPGMHRSGQGEDDKTFLSTWWFCPGCSHGGHSSCLQAWHGAFETGHSMVGAELDDASALESSEGLCPMDGCGHACLPGRGRDEVAVARTEETTRAVREAARKANKTATGLGGGIDVLGTIGGGIDHLAPDAHYASNGMELPPPYHSIRSDGHDIPQSRAVESVREALTGSSSHAGGSRLGLGTTSILSSSPGRSGERTDRERRKSVKFLPTTEER